LEKRQISVEEPRASHIDGPANVAKGIGGRLRKGRGIEPSVNSFDGRPGSCGSDTRCIGTLIARSDNAVVIRLRHEKRITRLNGADQVTVDCGLDCVNTVEKPRVVGPDTGVPASCSVRKSKPAFKVCLPVNLEIVVLKLRE